MNDAGMTERQKKWFATVRANFTAQTGRTLGEWVEVMKGCPETGKRAQLAWLKAEHGIGVNHGSHIIDACAPAGQGLGWDDPDGLRAALWNNPASLAILETVEVVARGAMAMASSRAPGRATPPSHARFSSRRSGRSRAAGRCWA